jgi:hypothetical protein
MAKLTDIDIAAADVLRDNAAADRPGATPVGAPDQMPPRPAPVPPAEAVAVVDFWRDAGIARWFAKDANFDRQFRERFLPWHEAAARGELAHWPASATGALALVVLLDRSRAIASAARPGCTSPTRWRGR